MDTTRADRLGCYGHDAAHTPVLDALAASGVRFERAYSQVPLTAPSHATMMTGAYPPENGVRMNGIHRLSEKFDTLSERFAKGGYRCGAFVAAFVLNSRFGLNQGFEVYGDQLDLNNQAYFDPLHQKRRGDRVCDEALEWLGQIGDKPFFCWVHFFDPHHPYESPEPYRTQNSNPYDGEIAFMDAQIGRLLDFLDRSGRRDHTLIVAVGDHGEGLGEHNEDNHATFIYDTTLHVPLIFNLPGKIGKGLVVPEVVRLVDVYPTLMDIMGWETPNQVSGESLIGALRGEAISERISYGESEYAYYDFGWSPLRSVTTDRWKYIRAPGPELYDLQADPTELKNLATSSPERLKEMETLLTSIEDDMVLGEAAKIQLDASEVQALQALGYAGTTPPVKPADDISKLKDPKNMRTVHQSFSMATDALTQGRFEEAKRLLEPIVRLSPESPKIHSKLGRAYLVAGELDQARSALAEAVRLQPGSAKTRNDLAAALAGLNLWDQAEAQYKESLKINPRQPAVFDRMTTIMLRRKKYDEALKHLQVGVDLDPTEPQLYVSMSRVYQAQGRNDEAIGILNKAVERAAYPTRAHEELAMLYKRAGKPAEAAKQFETAAALYQAMLKKVPRQPDMLNDLASVLIELKRYEEATKLLKTAMQTAPSRAQAYISMGRIHQRQNRLDEAERALRKAIELEPRNPRAHERLGAIMGQKEKWVEAKKHFQQAIQIDPTFVQAQVNLKRLEDYLASPEYKNASTAATSQPAAAP